MFLSLYNKAQGLCVCPSMEQKGDGQSFRKVFAVRRKIRPTGMNIRTLVVQVRTYQIDIKF